MTFDKMTIEELLEMTFSGSPEEKELAMNTIIKNNTKLVYAIINKYYPSYKDKYFEDMVQEGLTAIFEHCKQFDAKKGTFSTFMYPHIQNAIKQYICSHHGITSHYAKQLKDYNRALAILRERQVFNPTFGEIAEVMNTGVDAVSRIYDISCKMNHVSIDKNDDRPDKELTAYDSSPDEIYEKKESHEDLYRAIERLSPDESTVIKLTFFGREDGNKLMSLTEVASRMGTDTSTVRCLKNKALRKLQNILKNTSQSYRESKYRLEMEKLANSMTVSFQIPSTEIEKNIELSLEIPVDQTPEEKQDYVQVALLFPNSDNTTAIA